MKILAAITPMVGKPGSAPAGRTAMTRQYEIESRQITEGTVRATVRIIAENKSEIFFQDHRR
ncbi:MAG: hypothetical protein ACRD01_03675 [Terriglobales bacterium]